MRWLIIMAIALALSLPAIAIIGIGNPVPLADAGLSIDVDPAPPAAHPTVVTGQSTPFGSGAITVYAANGTAIYYNETYLNYFDVDPVPGQPWSVEYVATQKLSKDACQAKTKCLRNVVERLNITTGEITLIHERTYPIYHRTTGPIEEAKWHDFDRLNETHLVVADIYRNQVFVLDTRTGVRTWTWSAQHHFPRSGGGPFPYDWTHINDVELTEQGIMVSVRNFDQVVFLDQRTGEIRSNWTLGSDDDYGTLFEQHNPDYIPEANGGPAILVSDSENDRIVEYQRVNGAWEPSWAWSDDRLSWPRDADRLPSGRTLVTDTHGGRVLTVNASGHVTWVVEVGNPYEAERLGTGDESSGGLSTSGVHDASGSHDLGPAAADGASYRVPELAKLRHGIEFILPGWLDLKMAVAGVLGLVGLVVVGIVVLARRLGRRFDVKP